MDIWKKDIPKKKIGKCVSGKEILNIIANRNFESGNLTLELCARDGSCIEDFTIGLKTNYDLKQSEVFLNTKKYPEAMEFIVENKLGSNEDYKEYYRGFEYPLCSINIIMIHKYNGKEKK